VRAGLRGTARVRVPRRQHRRGEDLVGPALLDVVADLLRAPAAPRPPCAPDQGTAGSSASSCSGDSSDAGSSSGPASSGDGPSAAGSSRAALHPETRRAAASPPSTPAGGINTSAGSMYRKSNIAVIAGTTRIARPE